MANVIYNAYKKGLLDGSIDLANDTIKCALVTSAYIVDVDTHVFFSAITGEVVGSGYAAGGSTLTTPVNSQDDTDDEGVFDADDVVFSASTITARAAVLYKDTGVASTSPLIAYIDFGSDLSSTADDFTIAWNAEGILNIN